MRIKFWGSRGSVPVSGPEYLKYGGDTTCVEICSASGEILIIDAGTGIRRLGKSLLRRGIKNCRMLFTHAHWDHIMGFPFFAPIYQKDFSIELMGCPFAQHAVRDMVSKTMEAPNFPVDFDKVAASFTFQKLCDGESRTDGLRILPVSLSHPNSGTGYRISEGKNSFVFLTDNELGFQHPGGLAPDDYAAFCRGAELLVHDAEFCDGEYGRVKGWGHSTWNMALELAEKAGVKKFGLYHHNADRSDSEIDTITGECSRRAPAGLEVFAVAAGGEVVL